MTPPRDRPQAPVQPQPPLVEQPQILRRPPQAAVAIPPLPEEAGERAINVIHLEAKGKEKVKEPKVMPVERTRTKKARVSKEVTGPLVSMETEEEGTSKKERKKRGAYFELRWSLWLQFLMGMGLRTKKISKMEKKERGRREGKGREEKKGVEEERESSEESRGESREEAKITKEGHKGREIGTYSSRIRYTYRGVSQTSTTDIISDAGHNV